MFDLDFENVWRERGRRQAELWARALAPKYASPLPTRPAESVDEVAVNDLVQNALARKELDELADLRAVNDMITRVQEAR